MDALALAGTFATIVGLLANFKAERGAASIEEFMTWLREQHQDQILARMDADRELAQELKVIFGLKHEDLVVKLRALTEQITELGTRIDGFAGLATHLAPGPVLSTQARELLRQLVASGATHAQQVIPGGDVYAFLGGSAGELEAAEPRFLNEDIATLELCGLIRLEHSPRGARKLVPTRLGYSYAERMAIGSAVGSAQ